MKFDQLVNDPFFTIPVSESVFEKWSNSLIDNFDPSGYELTILETLYAKANDIEVNEGALGHCTISRPWIYKINDNVIVDHSFQSIRCGFAGKALDQIEYWMEEYPSLFKLYSIWPKIGADVSLQYFNPKQSEYFELVHLEKDCRLTESIQVWMDRVEKCLQLTDWQQAIGNSRRLTEQWSELLAADDLSDLKARYFGFIRTYDTLSVI